MSLEGSHRFTLRYDDNLVKDAVRTFVWRRAVVEQKLMWGAAVALSVSSVYLIVRGDGDWIAGVTLTLALLPLLFVAVMWRAHHAATFGRYKRMAEAQAHITVDADGIDIVTDLGQGRLAWRNITEIWERPRAFMVFSGPVQFNTLPREHMPADIQAYLMAKAVRR